LALDGGEGIARALEPAWPRLAGAQGSGKGYRDALYALVQSPGTGEVAMRNGVRGVLRFSTVFA
jgi:hypothetical protein